MLRIAIITLALAGTSPAPHWDSPGGGGTATGVKFPTGTTLSSTTDGQMSVCKSTAAQDCLFVNGDTGGFSCTAPATDAAPETCSLKGRDAYAACTGGNCTPVGLGLSGGIGQFKFTGITQAQCAGDNVAIIVARVTGSSTITCTEGATWTCITDDNTCAAGLVTCITNAAGGVAGSRSTNNVYLGFASDILSVSVTSSDAACATAGNGSIGPIKAYGATTITGATGITGATTITGSVANGSLTTMTPTGTTQTIDWSASNVQKLDLESATGNVTITDSNKVATGVYTLIIQQDGGGDNRTVTFPATTYFAGGTSVFTLTVTATADAIDVVTMVCATTTICYATYSQDHK